MARGHSSSRKLDNEAEVLATLRRMFGSNRVIVFEATGSMSDTVRMFSKASVIVGPHGSAFANILFAPQTAVVVDIFQVGDPLCFHHIATALGQEYWAVPQPDGFWGDPHLYLPIELLKDTLIRAVPEHLHRNFTAPTECLVGQFLQNGTCYACPPGMYRFGGDERSCTPCHPGMYADSKGSSTCELCYPGTYAKDSGALICTVCPAGLQAPYHGAHRCVRRRRSFMEPGDEEESVAPSGEIDGTGSDSTADTGKLDNSTVEDVPEVSHNLRHNSKFYTSTYLSKFHTSEAHLHSKITTGYLSLPSKFHTTDGYHQTTEYHTFNNYDSHQEQQVSDIADDNGEGREFGST